RYKGTKVVSVAPDYAESVTHADDWIAANPGTDAAVAQAMTHVILDEFYEQRREPMFMDYAKQYTDMPFLLVVEEYEDTYKAGRFLRASDLGMEEVNDDWKPVIYDSNDSKMVIPNGRMGQRWEEGKKWNLILENDDGTTIDPQMSVLGEDSQWSEIIFPYLNGKVNAPLNGSLPVKKWTFADGPVKKVATVKN